MADGSPLLRDRPPCHERQAARIEVQVLRAMRSRIQYYTQKMLAGQMKSGFDYAAIHQTISAVITDYTLFYEEEDYLNIYELRNRKSGNLFSDLQQYWNYPNCLMKTTGSRSGRFCSFSSTGSRRNSRC
jgi:hypothetical protein